MDVTTYVIEAQDARGRMQEAKRQIKAEVRRKYEAQMKREIAERSADAEAEFARVLRRVHREGVSQSLLRREVLRTNVWSTWTYWRDLAEIEPERVTIRNVKDEAKAKEAYDSRVFEWVDGELQFLRSPGTGEQLKSVLRIQEFGRRGWFLGNEDIRTMRHCRGIGISLKDQDVIDEEVIRAVEAGEVAENDPSFIHGEDYDPERFQREQEEARAGFWARNDYAGRED